MADLNSPLDRTAFEALHDFAREAVVFLVDGAIGPNSHLASVGSGTLIKTAGGRIVVLTAAHNFDDLPDDGVSMGGEGSNAVSHALGAPWRHPSIDVALAVVQPEAAKVFGHAALAPEVVAATTDTAFELQNPMLLCGYPGDYRRLHVDRPAGRAHLEFACVSYVTTVQPELDEHGRYHARWKEGVLTEHDPLFPAVKPGEEFVVVRPHGISGGPLWRFRSAGKGQVWAPAKIGQIVGVACDYIRVDAVECCPSVAVWGDWFRETLAAIDATT